MKINDSAIKILSQSIIGAVEKAISIAPFDKTTQGRVLSVNSDGTYTVEFLGKTQSVKSNNTKTINVNDTVWIMIPQNNINNAFIL